MSNPKPLAVIYARVSTVRQVKEGNGLSSQITTCRKFAEERGFEVVDLFTDDETGRSDEREGFRKLKKWIRDTKGQERVVLIDAISRLSRDVEVYAGIRKIAREHGASFASPTFRFEDTPAGRFMETIHVGFGQLEAETNAETVVRRQTARLLEGHWCFSAPLGYRSNGKNPITPDSLAGVVREALEGFASGRFETQAAVKRFIEEQPEYRKARTSPLGNDRVNGMLRNVLYAGYVEHEARKIALRPGTHEGLISLATFQRIQDRLSEKSRGKGRAKREKDFPLRGHVLCAECGKKLTAAWCTGRNKGNPFPYYYCYRKGCPKKGKMVLREALEGEFFDLLCRLQPDEKTIEVTEKMLRDLWEHNRAAAAQRRSTLERRVQSLRKEAEKFLDRIVETDNQSVVAAYESRITKLQHEEAAVREKLAQIDVQPTDFDHMFKHTVDILSKPCEIWKKHDYEWKQEEQ